MLFCNCNLHIADFTWVTESIKEILILTRRDPENLISLSNLPSRKIWHLREMSNNKLLILLDLRKHSSGIRRNKLLNSSSIRRWVKWGVIHQTMSNGSETFRRFFWQYNRTVKSGQQPKCHFHQAASRFNHFNISFNVVARKTYCLFSSNFLIRRSP